MDSKASSRPHRASRKVMLGVCALLAAVLLIVAWIISGPWFHFSDTWQLIINTVTSISTFLMVFLIQNTQNRDAKAIHLKLNEIIRAMHPAKNEMISVEQLSDAELDRLAEYYARIRDELGRRKRSVA